MKLSEPSCTRVCISGCVVLVSQLAVLPAASAAGNSDTPDSFSVSIGQRTDNLNWNIAGSTVNIVSELKYQNIAITQLQTEGEFNFEDGQQLRINLDYGVINSGAGQDSDYNGNNRTQEYSRSINQTGGNVLDASLGFGEKLRLLDMESGALYVTPLVGLSLHQQDLTMTNGVQTIAQPPRALGPIPGMSSSYNAQWAGPWLGTEARVETATGWTMTANAEYHWVAYAAEANWNLRSDLAHPLSFRQTSTGSGIVMSVGASYPFAQNWKMNVTLERQQWTTHTGSDLIYFADGTVGSARLNAVNWDSTSYNLGIVHYF